MTFDYICKYRKRADKLINRAMKEVRSGNDEAAGHLFSEAGKIIFSLGYILTPDQPEAPGGSTNEQA